MKQWFERLKRRYMVWVLTRRLNALALKMQMENKIGSRVNIQVDGLRVGFSTNKQVVTFEDLGNALITIGQAMLAPSTPYHDDPESKDAGDSSESEHW